MGATGTESDRAFLGTGHDQADTGVGGQPGDQPGVRLLDLVPQHPVREAGQVDQRQVPGGEHQQRGGLRNRVGLAPALLLGGYSGAGRGVRGEALDHLVEGLAVALAERGALALPVVGEHHQVVTAGRLG